tara:strand:+ start:1889 stop:2584 length:696 start_codon:yes stop_codon:yes gene_type:complete
MKPILIFCHNYVHHNWYEIIEEQLHKLVNSGLYESATEIYYGAYAPHQFQLYKFIDLVKSFDSESKIKIVIHPKNDGERQTMILLQEVCKNYPDAYTLYYHTKGITSLQNHNGGVKYKNIESWRHILEYFNIELWEECIQKLQIPKNDICGVLYCGKSGQFYNFYYPGNFWWGKTSYLNNLPDMKERDNRMGCELWIGCIEHNWVNLYDKQYPDIYHEYFDPKNYRKDLDT